MNMRSVKPGDKWQPDAPEWMKIVDHVNRSPRKHTDLEPARRVDDGVTTCQIKNTTNQVVPAYGVLKLSAPSCLPTDPEHLEGFRDVMALDGVVPTFPDDTARYAILPFPVAPGEFGLGVVAGTCHAIIDVQQEWHRYADVQYNSAEMLESCPQGSAEILWKEEGTGEKHAVLRLGSAGTPIIDVVLNADLNYGTSTSAVIHRNGSATTQTVTLHHKHAGIDITFNGGDKVSAYWNDDVKEWRVLVFGGEGGGGGADDDAVVKITGGTACQLAAENAGCVHSAVLMSLGPSPSFCGTPWVDGLAIWVADLDQCTVGGSLSSGDIYVARKLLDSFTPFGGAAERALYVTRGTRSSESAIAVIKTTKPAGEACKPMTEASLSECIWEAKLQVVDTTGGSMCGPYTNGADVFASLITTCTTVVVLKDELYLAIKLGPFSSTALGVTRDAYGIIGSMKPLCEQLQGLASYDPAEEQFLIHAPGEVGAPGVCGWTTLDISVCDELKAIAPIADTSGYSVELVAVLSTGVTVGCGTVQVCELLTNFVGYDILKKQLLVHEEGSPGLPGTCQWQDTTTICDDLQTLPPVGITNQSVELAAVINDGVTISCGTVDFCDMLQSVAANSGTLTPDHDVQLISTVTYQSVTDCKTVSICDVLKGLPQYDAGEDQTLVHSSGTCQWENTTTICEELQSVAANSGTLTPDHDVQLISTVTYQSVTDCKTVSICDVLKGLPQYDAGVAQTLGHAGGTCQWDVSSTAITSICPYTSDPTNLLLPIKVTGGSSIAAVLDPTSWPNFNSLKRQYLAHKKTPVAPSTEGCDWNWFFEWIDEEDDCEPAP